jgi:hypothetical protein
MVDILWKCSLSLDYNAKGGKKEVKKERNFKD